MANLSKKQIDDLKDLGFINSTDDSTELAGQSVDSLKNKLYITEVVPSADIEAAVSE